MCSARTLETCKSHGQNIRQSLSTTNTAHNRKLQMLPLVTVGALVSTITTGVFLIVAFLGKSFLLSSPFSYSALGDLTPTNRTYMQLYFTKGETYLDDVLQPSSSCTSGFTELTCNLLTYSTAFMGVALILAVLTFILLCLSRKGGQSKIHGSYIITSILTVIFLILALLGANTASSRLLSTELPDAQTKKLNAGILMAVKARVVEGISQKWGALNKAAETVQWILMNGAGLIKDSKCFGDITSTADVIVKCLSEEGQDIATLNQTGYASYHGVSVVKAFNVATNLSLPETVTPPSIYKMIATKGFEMGNGTFKVMSATVDKSIHENITMSTGLGYTCLIGGLVASIVAMVLVLIVFRQRYRVESIEESAKAKI